MKDKMKKTGYGVIIFSMVLSILILIPFFSVESDIALPLIYFWTGTGITLLFGNAGKRIGAQAVQNKYVEASK